MNHYKVLIADRQELVVETLQAIVTQQPDLELIDCVTSEYFIQKALETHTIHLLITDFQTMDYRGIEQLGQIQQQYTFLNVMVLANTITKREVLDLTRVGIKVILSKMCAKSDIPTAIEACIKMRKFYSPEILDLLTKSDETTRPQIDELGQLTSTELEIVKLIAQGLTTKEIASKKHSSFHTVMTHRKNIFRKLEINNASELVLYAIKSGIIEPMEYYI